MSEWAWNQLLRELWIFASFTTAEQRYIRRSLEVSTWGCGIPEGRVRGRVDAATLKRQARLYEGIAHLRLLIPDDIDCERSISLVEQLTAMSAFDLAQGKLTSFAAFCFLYERLLGARIRPWLPSAFCAAAMLPCIHPELRKELLLSLHPDDVGASGWSSREPEFLPEWVDKVPAAHNT